MSPGEKEGRMSTDPTPRRRSDYRIESPTSLRGYLLHRYPLGEDFTTHVTGEHKQLHKTAKHPGGGFIETGEDGKPDLTDEFMAELSGVSAYVFKDAIARVSETDPKAMLVLRWHQLTHKTPRHKFAYDLEVSERSLTNWLNKAVTMIREALPDDARWAVERAEREMREAA